MRPALGTNDRRRWTAPFATFCTRCGNTIHAGDPIGRIDGGLYICTTCHPILRTHPATTDPPAATR